jgi:hypothetical protein
MEKILHLGREVRRFPFNRAVGFQGLGELGLHADDDPAGFQQAIQIRRAGLRLGS